MLKRFFSKNKIILSVFFLLAFYPVLAFNIESIGGILLLFVSLFTSNFKLNKEDFYFLISASSFYFLSILTLIYTENIDYGFKVITRGISILIIPLSFVFLKMKFKEKHIFTFFRLYILSLTLLGLYLVYHITVTLELYSFRSISLAFTSFSFKYGLLNIAYKDLHSTYISAALVLGILLSIEQIFVLKSAKFKACFYFSTVFFFLMILGLRSRIALIASVVVPIYFILNSKISRRKPKTKYFSKVLIITFLLFMGFFTYHNEVIKNVIFNKVQSIKNSFLSSSFDKDLQLSRIDIYNCSINIIENNLYFGVGVGDVQDELNIQYKNNGLDALYTLDMFNSHNQYLHYLLESGLLGLALFLLFIGGNLKFSLTSKDYLYTCFIIMFSLFALTENILNRIGGIFFVTIFNSIFYYRNNYLLTEDVQSEE